MKNFLIKLMAFLVIGFIYLVVVGVLINKFPSAGGVIGVFGLLVGLPALAYGIYKAPLRGNAANTRVAEPSPRTNPKERGIKTKHVKRNPKTQKNSPPIQDDDPMDNDDRDSDTTPLFDVQITFSSANGNFALPKKSELSVTFIPASESINVGNFCVKGPIFTGVTPENQYVFAEPSLIDPTLPLQAHSLSDPLGYYPNYSRLSPAQRGAFLQWLVGDRGATEELGHVFLYFYGMERYVLRTAPSENESCRNENLRDIENEILRLKTMLSHSKSFQHYANQLLDVIFILHWPERLDERKLECPHRGCLAAHYRIAKQANTDPSTVLDSDWALQWHLIRGDNSISKAIRDNYPVLRALFRQAYERLPRGGILVPVCKTKFRMAMTPAAQGLDDVAILPTPTDWCDPSSLKSPLKVLAAVFEQVIPVLRAFSRAIAQGDRLALLATWPAGVDLRTAPEVNALADKIISGLSTPTTITIADLAQRVGLESSEKMTKSRIIQLASALETCGLAMVPDPVLSNSTIKANEKIRVYQGQRPKQLSPAAQALELHLRLGCILALADGEMHQNELHALNQLIDAHPEIHERQFLAEYLYWRIEQPPSIAGLKQHIELLSQEAKETLSTSLVELALSDGALPKSEIKQLEKFFTQLGFQADLVVKRLHGASVLEPVKTVRSALVDQKDKAVGIALNQAALQAHAQATHEIQSVLKQIFDEEENPTNNDTEASAAIKAKEPSIWYDELDQAHCALLEWVITQEEWPLAEFQARCATLKLMPDGAMDTINKMAFTSLGDSLLDAGDPITVYLDVLPSKQ